MRADHRVLVVDDSAFAQKVITLCLSGTEFSIVASASTGSEAIAQYRSCTPEIVLLDVILPDIMGCEVLRSIMQIDPEAKVVMVSSLGTEENVTECLSIGARSFVQKPVSKDTLVDRLREIAN